MDKKFHNYGRIAFFVCSASLLIIIFLSNHFAFTNRNWSYLIHVFFVLGLVSLAPLSLFLRHYAIKFLSLLILTPISLFALLMLPFAIWEFYYFDSSSSDPSFEKIKTYTLKENEINVYRTNGGATTSFGIVVRWEKSLGKHFKYIKILLDESPAHDAELTFTDNGQIEIFVPPYGAKRPHEIQKTIEL